MLQKLMLKFGFSETAGNNDKFLSFGRPVCSLIRKDLISDNGIFFGNYIHLGYHK